MDDPRTDEELLTAALACDLDADTDDIFTPYDEVIHAFWSRASTETLAKVLPLVCDLSPRVRLTGMHLLKVHIEAEVELETIAKELFARLAMEEDPDVLGALATALGFLYPTGVRQREIVAALDKLRMHPNADVRYSVAGAYWHIHGTAAVEPLLQLMIDPDPDVRDWATFGLGSMNHTDTPVIRDALAARLTDENPNVWGEALAGLALRSDARAVEVLLSLPAPKAADAHTLEADALVDAGRYTADPRLLPLLEQFASNLCEAGKELWDDLRDALKACRSGIPVRQE
jgi:HEAT repeat protein